MQTTHFLWSHPSRSVHVVGKPRPLRVMFTFYKIFGAPPLLAAHTCTMDIVMEGLLVALVLLHLSAAADNLYALTATDIAGNKVSLQQYKGKVLFNAPNERVLTMVEI